MVLLSVYLAVLGAPVLGRGVLLCPSPSTALLCRSPPRTELSLMPSPAVGRWSFPVPWGDSLLLFPETQAAL